MPCFSVNAAPHSTHRTAILLGMFRVVSRYTGRVGYCEERTLMELSETGAKRVAWC
jgi:hypothetical protein